MSDHAAGRETGRAYWRSLEELAGDPAFRAALEREFPERASEWHDPASRRRFLKLMGASIALAGASGCGFGVDRPEVLVPPVRQPEDMVPGRPRYYASAFTLGGLGTGVLVESYDGRPIKVEGNELHPASLGAADVFAQASVLTLYDPDRSQVVMREGNISTLATFLSDLGRALDRQKASRGAGVRILTEDVGSPTLRGQIEAFLKAYPEAGWVSWEPAASDGPRAGALRAFGVDVEPRYDFSKADVILALDADFLGSGPGALRYARQFADRRRLPSREMNRLYAVESTPGSVGAIADHRIAVRPGLIESLAREVARRVGVAGVGAEGALPESLARHARWMEAVAADLAAHRGRGVVVAGPEQPAAVHVLAHAMNDVLGNAGQTVVYADPVVARPSGASRVEALRALVRDMEAGLVELLVILGGNPAYTAPADIGFAAAMRKVARAVHLSLYEDETSALCRWHVNASHELEHWGDARAFDGTATIIQPLIEPLYRGVSPYELMAAMLGRGELSGREIVREHWRGQGLGGEDFEAAWERAVHDGVIEGTATAPREVTLRPDAIMPPGALPPDEALEICFRPDPTVWDGRFANNGWLQELPKPLTKLTWDNAALMGPATAARLGVDSEDRVELSIGGRRVTAPVWVVPGHAEGCVTAHLGYGRSRVGRVGEGTGFNAYLLRDSSGMHAATGLSVRKVAGTYRLACTQSHRSMEGRDLVRTGTLEQYLAEPEFAKRHGDHLGPEDSMYPPHAYEGHAWGMVVNLNACIGCNACVIGCQSENNVPIVGKDQVLRSREMHWLEIDRYYGGDADDPTVELQPRLCMHCEKAPCELVCPVIATSHSAEGLNEMTYNRCIGTRYCSNNCPYKVRHFNFLDYTTPRGPSLVLLNNPDVTVRSRGVMEKCTYCVQRINRARQEAKVEGRTLRDGDVVTACQAACPTGAIVFGDINDESSEVSRLKAQPLNFGLLAELNTRPRTTYLARVRNPNPALEPAETEAAHGARSH